MTTQSLFTYFKALRPAKVVLWCYLIWYFFMLGQYFEPKLSLWLNSLGISLFIGLGLLLSVMPKVGISGMEKWQIARLFIMPFCVSSFAAIIKDRGFMVIFSPLWQDNLGAMISCFTFVIFIWLCKKTTPTH
ncbi:MAG: hypothetical protein WCH96_10220, partial [Betaproteobacteria bacterium]